MNKVEKIRAEIERRKNQYDKEADRVIRYEYGVINRSANARYSLCKYLLEYIDSLEEDKFERPNIKINDAIEVSSRMKYIDEDLKPIAEFIMDYCSWNLHKDEWNQPTIEVPLFRVLDTLMLRGKPYCCD